MSARSVYRTFLSSPGDVQPEREAAERVVRRLTGIYTAHVDLRLERWEPRFYSIDRYPLPAGLPNSFPDHVKARAELSNRIVLLVSST